MEETGVESGERKMKWQKSPLGAEGNWVRGQGGQVGEEEGGQALEERRIEESWAYKNVDCDNKRSNNNERSDRYALQAHTGSNKEHRVPEQTQCVPRSLTLFTEGHEKNEVRDEILANLEGKNSCSMGQLFSGQVIGQLWCDLHVTRTKLEATDMDQRSTHTFLLK